MWRGIGSSLMLMFAYAFFVVCHRWVAHLPHPFVPSTCVFSLRSHSSKPFVASADCNSCYGASCQAADTGSVAASTSVLIHVPASERGRDVCKRKSSNLSTTHVTRNMHHEHIAMGRQCTDLAQLLHVYSLPICNGVGSSSCVPYPCLSHV